MEKTLFKTSSLKKLGFLGFALCGLCCTLPALGLFLGVSSLAAIGLIFEKIALAVVFVVALVAGYLFFSKRSKAKCSPACNIDCECKSEKQ